MSLDDECPTQYFGPDRVELTIQGKEVSMSKDEYFRLTEKPGALTEEEMLNARIDGLSLADILAEANTQHRPGCASSRNRTCTCEYLAQWDQPALAGPGILMMPDGWVLGEDYQPPPGTPTIVMNNPEHRWVTGDQLPPRETGR